MTEEYHDWEMDIKMCPSCDGVLQNQHYRKLDRWLVGNKEVIYEFWECQCGYEWVEKTTPSVGGD